MTIVQDRLARIEALRLSSGAHLSAGDEMCVMEAVAFVAGERWSDHPRCASKVIGAFLRNWNDALGDEERQKLKPYIVKVVGSAGTAAVEKQRAWLCADWLIRRQAPAWLDLAGCTEQAATLRALPPIVSSTLAKKHQPALDAALAAANAAWAAVRTTAKAAGAAGAAAGAAAEAAAWAAARAAARAAAWAAAGAAVKAAAEAAAAAAAAKKKLAPTVTSLQASAFELLDAMLALSPHALLHAEECVFCGAAT
jgi:hypothetical protein